MGAKITSVNQVKLLTAQEAIERIFAGIESPEVKHELSKWHALGEAIKLHHLTPEQLADLMDRLPDLVLALYSYQMEIQKGADK
jgi:hypothetical protein